MDSPASAETRSLIARLLDICSLFRGDVESDMGVFSSGGNKEDCSINVSAEGSGQLLQRLDVCRREMPSDRAVHLYVSTQ